MPKSSLKVFVSLKARQNICFIRIYLLKLNVAENLKFLWILLMDLRLRKFEAYLKAYFFK